jgi:hypothetical protein
MNDNVNYVNANYGTVAVIINFVTAKKFSKSIGRLGGNYD